MQHNNFKEFYCTGTNLTRQRIEIFSWQNTPNMLLKTAVRISGSIPIYYKPVIIDSAGVETEKPLPGVVYNYYVDGGMLENFPITMFDTCRDGSSIPFLCSNMAYNRQTLGLKLDRPEQIEQYKNSVAIPDYPILTKNNYLGAFFNLLQETLQRKSINLEEEKGRTIYISQGQISAAIKKMKEEEKNELYDNGKSAVEKFFNLKILSAKGLSLPL
jgi:NTE family protein